MPAVLHQLPDIPQHVVQAEFVLRAASNGRRGRKSIVTSVNYRVPFGVFLPAAAIQHVRVPARPRSSIAPVPRRLRTATRCVLPFRFAQEPTALARLHRQPLHVGPGVLPAHAYHGMVIGPGESRFEPVVFFAPFPFAASERPTPVLRRMTGFVHEPTELPARHFVSARGKSGSIYCAGITVSYTSVPTVRCGLSPPARSTSAISTR